MSFKTIVELLTPLVILGLLAVGALIIMTGPDKEESRQVATILGDKQVRSYDQDPYICFVLVDTKDSRAGAISCVHK